MNLSFSDIQKAQNRIQNYIVKTPILTNQALNEKLGAEIYFKCENFQTTGSFKFRGAANKILKFKEENGFFPKKIVAVSSGNHAGAVAYLAKKFGIEAIIFMDKRVSAYKIRAVKGYGAQVELVDGRAEADLQAVKKEAEGYLFVHPSNDEDIICGQGTACLEAIDELGNFDVIFAPCGGGGLISSSYIAAQILEKKPQVFACEPVSANDAAISFRTGKIHNLTEASNSIADGIRTPHLSEKTFPYFQKLNGVFENEEEEIIRWTQIASSYLKIFIEPTAGVALASCYQFLQKTKPAEKLKILVILSGGNMSLETVQQLWQKDYLEL